MLYETLRHLKRINRLFSYCSKVYDTTFIYQVLMQLQPNFAIVHEAVNALLGKLTRFV